MPLIKYLAASLLLILAAGCGVQDYDTLVRGRMQQLQAENQVTPLEWSEFRSKSGLMIDVPATPNPTISQQGEASAEELSMEAGGMSFRVVFMTSPNIESGPLSDSSQKQFRDEGFSLTERKFSALRAYALDLVNMEHAETGEQAIIRVYQIDPNQVCVMTVTGRRIANNSEVNRFFESVRPAE